MQHCKSRNKKVKQETRNKRQKRGRDGRMILKNSIARLAGMVFLEIVKFNLKKYHQVKMTLHKERRIRVKKEIMHRKGWT